MESGHCEGYGIHGRRYQKSMSTAWNKDHFQICTHFKIETNKGQIHSGIVYEIPCTCGKVYVGETIRRLGTRIKEHKEACQNCSLDKSAIAEHAWTEHHPIQWDNIKILDKANRQDLLRIKEAVQGRESTET